MTMLARFDVITLKPMLYWFFFIMQKTALNKSQKSRIYLKEWQWPGLNPGPSNWVPRLNNGLDN